MRRAWVILVVGIAASVGSPVEAHRFAHPKVLRVGVSADRIVLAATYDVNPGADALRTRGLFDRNADGKLDEAEQTKLERYLVQTATLWMKFEVDGQRISLAGPKITRHRLDRDATDSSTLGIALLWTVPSKGDEIRIRIEDRDKDREAHVPIVVDVAAPLFVRLATQGAWDPDARRIFGGRLAPGRDLELVILRQP